MPAVSGFSLYVSTPSPSPPPLAVAPGSVHRIVSGLVLGNKAVERPPFLPTRWVEGRRPRCVRTAGKVNIPRAVGGGTLELEKSSLCPRFTRRLIGGHPLTRRLLDHWLSSPLQRKAPREGVFRLAPVSCLLTTRARSFTFYRFLKHTPPDPLLQVLLQNI